MKQFNDIFEEEIISTIEALVGVRPTLELKEIQELSVISSIIPPVVRTISNCEFNSKNCNILFAIPTGLATNLGDMMIGEEITNDVVILTDDHLDATKEVIYNILGAISNVASYTKNYPKFNLTNKPDIKFVDNNQELSLEDYSIMYSYKISLGDFHSFFNFAFDSNLQLELDNIKNKTTEKNTNEEEVVVTQDNKKILIDKIKNIEMEVTLRVGKTEMLLRDIININIGSVIKLDQISNAPVELLVEGTVIALGEVVIVDGNFGLQVTEIISNIQEN